MRGFSEVERAKHAVISGWRAVVLAPLLIPLALLLQLLPGKKTEDRSAEEVAGFLRDFIEGTGGDWDWDEFECVPITNYALDRIRREAALAGPPNANIGKLQELLARAESLAGATPHPSASG
jgi:hypothetical protein